MSRTSTYLVILNGVICVFFFIYAFFLGHFFTGSRTVRSDVLQGILIGFALAFVSAQIYARFKATNAPRAREASHLRTEGVCIVSTDYVEDVRERYR